MNGGTVIKGYDLLGYHESPVPVAPGEMKKLVYFVTTDMDIKAFDNIKVDLAYGVESPSVDKSVECNMAVKLSEAAGEPIPQINSNPIEAPLFDYDELDAIELVDDVPLDGGVLELDEPLPLDGCATAPAVSAHQSYSTLRAT